MYVTLGEADMDVATTLASLRNAHFSSPRLSDHDRKILKIRYVYMLGKMYLHIQAVQFLTLSVLFFMCN